jgi:hypothetical protein
MKNNTSLRNMADLSLAISLLLLLVYCYYSGYQLFDAWGWSSKPTDQVLMRIAQTHLFDSPARSKVLVLLFLSLSMMSSRGRKEQRISIRGALWLTGIGLVLFWLPYILPVMAGWLLVLAGAIRLTRILGVPRASDDPFGKRQAGFPQEERRLESEFGLHLRGLYTHDGKQKKSWINLVNPRRGILIMGSPGSGKSWFIIESLMRQWMEKGFALFIYDFKYDALSRVCWGLFQRYHQRYPPGSAFYSINFSDLSRSHRCNVLEPATLEWVADAIGASKTILLSMNKTWIQRQGEFFVESPINFLAAVIWYLKKYQDGRYCTLPHAIELAQMPYESLFSILRTEPEIQALIQPFIDAYQNKSMEMLDGQVASAKIPLARLASPELYYILTGQDFSLAINDPAAPKIFCLGGDPRRQEALSPVLSLYIDQLNKICNRPGRSPCALVCDEFATVRAYSMTTTIATGRSNNIVSILAVQDLVQLRLQYSKEEADSFLQISGNLLCGQAGGETARSMSERFSKVLKDRHSVSTNSTDTSVNVAPHWEQVVGPATIAGLSSGEFLGIVADDPGKQVVLKAFHARIIREEEPPLPEAALPVVRSVSSEAVQEQFRRVRQDIFELVDEEMARMAGDEGLAGMILK